MVDLKKGLTEYTLSEEELEKYRNLPRPRKYGNTDTLAPRDLTRKSLISTTTIYPNGLKPAKR